MSFRITFSKVPRAKLSGLSKATGTVGVNSLLIAADRVELRETDGTIVRLAKGAHFELKDGPLGIRPEYGGSVYIARKGGCGKYVTSCWVAAANPLSERPDLFIRPSDKPDTDEFFALSGDIVIYEFDAQSRTFTICTINEGEKALVTHDPKAKSIQDRYKSSVVQFTDAEYEYILKEFIDRRKWI